MDKTDGTSSETIEFGGSPRWLRVRGATFEVALIALAIGVAIGFAGGRVTAGHLRAHTGHRGHARAGAGGVLPGSPPITFTGRRCATQLGSDLQLGIEIENDSAYPVRIARIATVLALGGLREVASGTGTCGALPDMASSAPTLSPGATEWVTITAAVRVRCPEPLPVAFMIGYAQAGKPATTTINAFPDLGPVAYQHCGQIGQGAPPSASSSPPAASR